MALAFGKPIVLVAEPGATVPSDLTDALIVRAPLDDVDAVTWALEHTEGRRAASAAGATAQRSWT
ncbi:MAG: hypothetical protein QOJ82_1204 [Solirubrobacteraceae bacterium]|jgi:hypothetical protein|nr:hypothetical protein [Solirubrobacteraceae bacterium]